MLVSVCQRYLVNHVKWVVCFIMIAPPFFQNTMKRGRMCRHRTHFPARLSLKWIYLYTIHKFADVLIVQRQLIQESTDMSHDDDELVPFIFHEIFKSRHVMRLHVFYTIRPQHHISAARENIWGATKLSPSFRVPSFQTETEMENGGM